MTRYYLQAGLLLQKNEEFPISSDPSRSGDAYPEFYLRSSGFADGIAAQILDNNRNVVLEVFQDTYIKGRRMQMGSAEGKALGTIVKLDHKDQKNNKGIGAMLKRMQTYELDTFAIEGGSGIQAVRKYPSMEIDVIAPITNGEGGTTSLAKVGIVSRTILGTSSVMQFLAARMEGENRPGRREDYAYTLTVSENAETVETARLILLAVLMEEATFAPHVRLPPNVSVPDSVKEWAASPQAEALRAPAEVAVPSQPLEPAKLDLDLEQEGAALLRFLHEVDSTQWLHSKLATAEAVRRYETCWLPILAKHCSKAGSQNKSQPELAAPLDVAWAWFAHSVAPSAYARDFLALTGLPATSVQASVPHRRREAALAAGRAAWEAQFPEEPFEVPPRTINETLEPELAKCVDDTTYECKSSYDIASGIARQSRFLYQVALPHWVLSKSLLCNAARNYLAFLALQREHRAVFLVPTYDIDLMWHAHQANHAAYVAQTVDANGQIFDHDDSKESREEGGIRNEGYCKTSELFKHHFGGHFVQSGAGYRGEVLPDRYAPGAAPIPLTPCHNKKAPTTFVLRQHGITAEQQPVPLYTLNDMPEGGVAVRLDACVDGASVQPAQYQIWMQHQGPYSTSATVHVVDSKGEVAAVARLVGQEQLPVLQATKLTGSNVAKSGFANLFKPPFPALLAYPNHPPERAAFLISSRSHDWGVASATWFGHVSAKNGFGSAPGHFDVRLMRLGEAGTCMAYRTSAHMGGSRLSFKPILGGSENIILQMDTPTKVIVMEGESAACALAFAGAVSLHAMILGLPVAALEKSKFAAGLLAAHGLSVCAPVKGHREVLPKDLENLGFVGGYTRPRKPSPPTLPAGVTSASLQQGPVFSPPQPSTYFTNTNNLGFAQYQMIYYNLEGAACGGAACGGGSDACNDGGGGSSCGGTVGTCNTGSAATTGTDTTWSWGGWFSDGGGGYSGGSSCGGGGGYSGGSSCGGGGGGSSGGC